MRTLVILISVLLLTSCLQKAKEERSEEPIEDGSVKTKEAAWQVLFDGTSFEGWHFYGGGEVAEPWKLEDGALVFYPPEQYPEGVSYNIVTDKAYTNFVLSLEWKIAEAGNSGIFWGVFEDAKYGQPYETGPEIQVLDNAGHPDSKNGPTRQAGALYDMVPPSIEMVKPAGEWNTVELTINHQANQGLVVFNGTKISEFPVHGKAWDAMVADSKFADWEGFGAYRTGKIGLQDHGDIVAYRNIKIKEL